MLIERVLNLAPFIAPKTEADLKEALKKHTQKAITKTTDDYFSSLKGAEREISFYAFGARILRRPLDQTNWLNTCRRQAETELLRALDGHITQIFERNKKWSPQKQAWFTRFACATQARSLVARSLLTTDDPYITESAILIARRVIIWASHDSNNLTQTFTDSDWLKKLSLNILHQNLRALDDQLPTFIDNPPPAIPKD